MSEDLSKYRPKTIEELLEVIAEALGAIEPSPPIEEFFQQIADGTYELPVSYSQSADALWKAALAAFNYVAHTLSVTGWQASWAELQFLRHSRGLQGPFALLDANDLLYPQYDLRAKVEEYIEEWGPWAADQAREKLAKDWPIPAVETVQAHWRALAAAHPPVCPIEGCEIEVVHGHGTDAKYRPRQVEA